MKMQAYEGPQSAFHDVIKKLTWWVLALPAIMILALVTHNLFWLDFSHVMSGVLWTGTDIFMGFILGPIIRRLEPGQRRALINWLTPKTMLYTPVLAVTTGTAGWFLAMRQNMLVVHNPARPWILFAIVDIALLSVQGFGILLPNSIRTYVELHKPVADVDKIFRLNRRNNPLAGSQGILQILIMLIMVLLVIQ